MTPEETKTIQAALAKAELVAALSEETRKRLAGSGHVVSIDPGALLFSKGDPGDGLYVLIEGEVEVRAGSEGGRDVRLAALKAPALLGEMAMLDGGARSADVAALRRAKFLKISREAALAALESEPKALLLLLAEMSRRLRAADAALEDAALLDLGGKLAQRLLEEAGSGAMVTLTQTELARRIGASREKVNRKLHDWNEEGFVELSRSGIKLKDKARLETLITRARNA
jgi:CRP-like cAMP-binding protein